MSESLYMFYVDSIGYRNSFITCLMKRTEETRR